MEQLISLAILGLIEGLTEFIPVSSSGHLIVAREFFGFTTQGGLAVDAVLQLSSVCAVVVYFWRDFLTIFRTAFMRVQGRAVHDADEKLLSAIIVGTIPAVIVGIFVESYMETIFRNAALVAYALLAGSLVMLVAELYSRKMFSSGTHEELTIKKGALVGLFQAIALIPGMSRSGMTISGGLLLGLSREASARFGFLLAVPIILGSGLKKLLELGADGTLLAIGPGLFLGSLVAFLSGLAAIHILLLFLRTRPLYVFIAYRVLLACAILFFI